MGTSLAARAPALLASMVSSVYAAKYAANNVANNKMAMGTFDV